MSFYLFNLTPSYLEGSPPPPSHFSEGEPPFNSPLHNPFHSFLGNGRDSPPPMFVGCVLPYSFGESFLTPFVPLYTPL
ncbi:hypothetical protein MBMB1_1764 [Methanobacterium sp. MB1]|nr:hypothetical protein MBMB1_1764 [Methanobacterium sp. MB1]